MGLRTKILKPSGASHTDIDITYYNVDDNKLILRDEVDDLKITVFTRNEKGKVVKRKINTRSFASERIDNNYMVLHVTVPDVEAGSIVEYQYSITSTRPTFLYDWVFQESIPTVHSKCDIDVPAFLQFKMNTPINKLIKAGVEVGRLTYDVNRTDLKKAKSFPTNHYTIEGGDYILPEGYALKRSQDGADEKKEAIQEEIAPFTSQDCHAQRHHPCSTAEGPHAPEAQIAPVCPPTMSTGRPFACRLPVSTARAFWARAPISSSLLGKQRTRRQETGCADADD